MVSIGDFTELTVKEDAFCTTASKVRILKMGYVGTFNDNKTGSSSPAAHFGNSNITAGINDGAFNPVVERVLWVTVTVDLPPPRKVPLNKHRSYRY